MVIAEIRRLRKYVRRLKITFSDKGYIGRLDTSDKRWIDEEISVVTNGLLEFVAKI